MANMALLLVVGGSLIAGIAVLFMWIIPKLAEKESFNIGFLNRSAMFSKMKSDNRLYNMLRTGFLWVMGIGIGVSFLLMFMFEYLADTPVPTTMRNITILVCMGLSTFLIMYAIRLHNRGRKQLCVTHHIALSMDGVITIDKDVRILKTEEVGGFAKTDRTKYFSELGIQFCPHFKEQLLTDFASIEVAKTYKDHIGNWDWDKLAERATDHFKWNKTDPTDWDVFCLNNCGSNGGEYCSFQSIRNMVLEQDKWKIYEANIEQFGVFPKAIYIMENPPDEEFAKFEKQFAVDGVVIGVHGADINCLLVDINHTIDIGNGGELKPTKVLAPIFWVYASAPIRRRLFDGITPDALRGEELETILFNRTTPSGIKRALQYVKDSDDKYKSAMEVKVADKKQSYEWAANLFDNMLKAGKVIRDYKQQRWFWIFMCVMLGVFAMLGYIFITKNPAGGEQIGNSTIGALL